MDQTGGGLYWSIVAVDASGIVVGRPLARDHGEIVRRAWARLCAEPPRTLDPAVHELVLRDTRNRGRERHAIGGLPELGAAS